VRGRKEATGRGLFFAIREACSIAEDMKALGLEPGLAGKRMIVQGLGNVGYHVAKFCHEGGAVIVAIAEYEGAIANPNGLDPEAVTAHRKATKSILGFPGATDLKDSASALELDADILVPAALENVLTGVNAARIKAKIVLEGANGPTTPDAEEIFRQRGIMVLPDIYANAGGVTVSYFEWVQGLQQFFWTEQEVNDRLIRLMQRASKDVWGVSRAKGVDLRTAALMRGIERVTEAKRRRGVFP
jgi:glutamate dehydrogenase (NAD(P)+)